VDLGLMMSIEHVALRESCEQASLWQSLGEDVRLSINICVQQLAEIDKFEAVLHKILAGTSMPASRLTCEITEHAHLDANPQTLKGMRRLAASGVSFSIDDFGTGFGSMTYLRLMPIHEIKIDRSFVENAPTDPVAAAILRAHAILASELGVRCVAEGVETPEQHALVSAVGVGQAQGFLYQEPVPADRLLFQLRSLTGAMSRLYP
jgi:EAL domain-containing protein (putative c-di-GMP-specific phosphodiesterase class I)